MPVAGAQYGYQVAPWDSPLSFGVQAIIEYNGIVMNDRRQADRIRITGITGLDDAEVEDNRDPVPGLHGEVPYDAHYRGRTFVLNGKIQAGSLGGLKRLERDLKAAFASLEESPMKFRWFDFNDTFDDPATIGNYTVTNLGNATLGTIENSIMPVSITSGGGGMLFLRTADKRMFGDYQQTLKFYVTKMTALSRIKMLMKYQSTSTYISADAATSFDQSQILGLPDALVGGVGGLFSSTEALAAFSDGLTAGPTLVEGQPLWLRGRLQGDNITVELWDLEPREGAIPRWARTFYIMGLGADALGEGVMSTPGFWISAQSGAASRVLIDDYKVESLAPGDVMFMARKLSSLSIKDSQDSPTRFSRDFQITMRASQFVAHSATEILSQAINPSVVGYPSTRGRVYPRSYPLIYNKYLSVGFSAYNNKMSLYNRGTVFTEPKIIIKGADVTDSAGPVSLQGVTITNLTNGQQLNWNGSLDAGDVLTIDCDSRLRTITDSTGQSRLSDFSPTSDWIVLEPGWNDLVCICGTISNTAKVFFFARHGWL